MERARRLADAAAGPAARRRGTGLSAGAALPLRLADLRGLSRLGIDAVLGVAGIAEALHLTIASRSAPLGRGPEGTTRGITGLVYRSVRGTTRAVGAGLDALLGAVASGDVADGEPDPRREALLAALNGVLGDHLHATRNPLAVPMALRVAGRPWDPAAQPPSRRILVLVHGLAMNDLQWSRRGHDHGQALARDLGFAPVYLHYNSGRHVSQNGREFALLLERLLAQWPGPVDELAIVGHSMGGLVARSACHLGRGQPWMRKLARLVCLGTPHHGAPLERGGRWVDALLGVSPYAAPFARLGRLRSAGITDLRFGNLQDADWQQHRERHAQARDDRVPVPLPEGVAVHAVAALRKGGTAKRWGALAGDGLVPLRSALGDHRDPALALHLPESRRLVVAGAGHWDLLHSAEVYAQLREWLA